MISGYQQFRSADEERSAGRLALAAVVADRGDDAAGLAWLLAAGREPARAVTWGNLTAGRGWAWKWCSGEFAAVGRACLQIGDAYLPYELFNEMACRYAVERREDGETRSVFDHYQEAVLFAAAAVDRLPVRVRVLLERMVR